MKEMYLLKQSCLLLYTGAVFCQEEEGGMGCDLVSSPKFLLSFSLSLILHSVSPFVP